MPPRLQAAQLLLLMTVAGRRAQSGGGRNACARRRKLFSNGEEGLALGSRAGMRRSVCGPNSSMKRRPAGIGVR
jgi:hypothetical protein